MVGTMLALRAATVEQGHRLCSLRGKSVSTHHEPRPGCPHPDKYGWDTRAEAEYARANQIDARDGGHYRHTRPYECRCGLWHLTSKPRDDGAELPPCGTLAADPRLRNLLNEMEQR